MNRNIERLYKVCYRSIFTTAGQLDYGRITDAIIRLAQELAQSETGEDIWFMGEFNEACLMDLLIGAYWHYTEWHAGQYSKSYAALCALGKIVDPGCSTGPEPGAGEQIAYDLLALMAGADV